MAYVKYGRTPHVPQSPGATSDDKTLKSLELFEGKRVVLTKKMDGENTSCYSDGHCHARSIDSAHHPSRAWVRQLAANVSWQLAELGLHRVCGENMFAQHSIPYADLESYLLVFSAWRSPDEALGWDETVEACGKLGLVTVPVLYDGMFEHGLIERTVASLDTITDEGFVMRLAGGFKLADFERSIAKWVRAQHVQTTEHWMHQGLIQNKLRKQA